MKKDTIIKVGSVVGVLVVLYFVYKKIKKESNANVNLNPQDTKNEDVSTPTTDNGYSKYKITTQSTSLNIRENPDVKSKIIGKLNKGQEVLLKASTTNGWMEYSTNGVTTFGFVSSDYVTKA
jgi:uncharacterized protein YgiM (DUF1202 family)